MKRLRLALSLNTCALLLLEAGLLRILSATHWAHVALLALTVALLGGGLGPLMLVLRPLSAPRRARWLQRCLLLLPALTPLTFLLFQALPFEPLRLLFEARQWALVPAGCLLLALPFFLSGLATVLLFAEEPPAALGALYAFDLCGAALGAPLCLLALPALGAWGVVLLSAALWAGAALLLAPQKAAPLLLGVLLLLPLSEKLPLRFSRSKPLLGAPSLISRWGNLGKVDVLRSPDGYRLVLDGGAAVSRMPRGDASMERDADVERVLQALRPRRVLIIGAGGGLEVRLALQAGAAQVVAVEMNPVIVDLVRGDLAAPLGHLFQDPRVTLVAEEGRHYLMRAAGRFDAILCVHTISNAALQAGGLALAESYALTREAFAAYYQHLAPGGALLFTRPRSQLARLYNTAQAAWPAGPGDFSRRARLYGRAADRFYGALLVPSPPLDLERAGLLAGLAQLGFTRQEPTADADALTTPATDDRPFFNQRVALGRLRPARLLRLLDHDPRLALEEEPVAEGTLLVLLLLSGALGGALYLLPLRGRGGGDGGGLRQGAYFGGLGVAFLLVEIPLLQALGLWLGQPAYAAALVLSALLLGAGLGSRSDPGGRGLLPLTAAAVAALALALPLAGRLLGPLPLGPRLALAALLVMPPALLMGRPFPRGLARCTSPAALAAAFAYNGLGAVLGSLLAPMLSMALGLRGALLCGAGLYLLLGGRRSLRLGAQPRNLPPEQMQAPVPHAG